MTVKRSDFLLKSEFNQTKAEMRRSPLKVKLPVGRDREPSNLQAASRSRRPRPRRSGEQAEE